MASRAPGPKDWTAIRIAQMREAGKQFGDFEQPAPGAKLLPRMDAAWAREILKYWYGISATAMERTSTKVGQSHIRLVKAVDRYRAEMQPFAATVLVDVATPSDQSLLMPYDACLKFWDATSKLTAALAAAEWAPDKSDLWWASVAEAASDAGKKAAAVATTGASWVLVALGLGALLVLGNSGSKERRG